MKLTNPKKYLIFYLCRNYFDKSKGESLARVFQIRSGIISLINIFYFEQLSQFSDYLKSYSKKQALIVIESEDAIITEEKIPYLIGFDRIAIIKRKAGQILGEDTLIHYFSKGRSKDKDRQETIVFLGIGDSNKWNPWILAIRDRKLFIKAVTIPTFICSSYHQNWRTSKTKDEILIQVAWNYGGLSQSVIANGLPIFSRFFPWLDIPYSDNSNELNNGWDIDKAKLESANQTKKLLTFLQGQGLWNPGQPTNLSVVLPANLTNANIQFDEIFGFAPNVVFAPTLSDIRYQLKDNASINYGAETLYIDYLVKSKKILQCAPDDIRYRYLNWLAMRFSSNLFFAILLICLVIVGYLGIEVGYHIYKSNQQQKQINTITARYNKLREQFPNIGISNDQLRQIIYLTDGLENCHHGLPDFFKQLAIINKNYPQIEFSEIEWDQNQTYKSEFKTKDLINTTEILCSGKYILKGYIATYANNSQRDLENIYNSWLADAEKLGVTIKNITSPVNIQTGKFSENQAPPERAEFEIMVTIK